jgi:hypothetical protein
MATIARARLGAFLLPNADPTAGKPGGAPITYPLYPCQIRYTADGAPQTIGSRGLLYSAAQTCTVRSGEGWRDLEPSNYFGGLMRWVDGIEMRYATTAVGGTNPIRLGWNLTPAGLIEYQRRVAELKNSGGLIYAPLPPGVDGTVKVILPENADDAVTMRYAIALDAATNRMDTSWRYYDPVDWKGYNVLPDGFLDPIDGGEATFASGDVLDGIQKIAGVAGNNWYWVIFKHPETGDLKAYLTQHIKSQENFFTKLGGNGVLAIQILGGVLALFTAGASIAAAAAITAAVKVEQAKAAASAAEQQQEHNAGVLQSQADFQEAQVTNQVDDFYISNQATFLAAGYDEAKWNSMSLQEKTDVIQLAADGRLQASPEAISAAVQVQKDLDSAIQSAAATAGTGVVATESVGSVGLLVALGAAGLIFGKTDRRSRR